MVQIWCSALCGDSTANFSKNKCATVCPIAVVRLFGEAYEEKNRNALTEKERIRTLKTKFFLISSILQEVVGILAIVAFVVLALGGEMMTRWIVTPVLAIAYAVMGIGGIVVWLRGK